MSTSPADLIRSKMRDAQRQLLAAQTSLRIMDARVKGFAEALAILPDAETSAGLRKKLEDKIRKERQAADEYANFVSDMEGRVSAFEETLKLIEKESEDSGTPDLRPNSDVFRIREAIRLLGTPMTLAQILAALGKDDTPENKNSIRGSVGRYARERKIFVQTAPNTFGLLELSHKPQEEEAPIEL